MRSVADATLAYASTGDVDTYHSGAAVASAAYAAADAVDANSVAAASNTAEVTNNALFAANSNSAYNAYVQSGILDFQSLLLRKLGSYGNLGRRINPDENGPLGDYWQGDAPSWFEELQPELEVRLVKSQADHEQLTIEIQTLRNQLLEKDKEVERLKTDIGSKAKQAEEVREQLAEAEKTRDEFQTAYGKLERDFAKEHRGHEQIQESLNSARSELTSSEASRSKAKEQLDECHRLRREQEDQIDELKRKVEEAEHVADINRPKSWGDHIRSLSEPSGATVLMLVALAVMLWAMLLSMSAISEIHARQQFMQILKDRAVSQNGNDDSDTAVQPQDLEEDLRVLIVGGAQFEDQTLQGVRNRLPSRPTMFETDTERVKADWWTRFLRVEYYGSDFLLSVAVMLAGTLGALVAGMRTDSHISIRQVALGVSAGFITFLVIRGGRAVFLLNPEGTSFVVNPYTSAFLGLVAGIFTDKAYRLLMLAVDEFIERIKVGFRLGENQNESGDTTDTASGSFPEDDGSDDS